MIARQFEDLIMWQRARELCKLVYTYTCKGAFKSDFGLRDQIRSAIVSVMSNIAEGFARGSNKEFVQFLFVAKGSLSEVQSQLYVALDQAYITDSEFKKAYELSQESHKIIGAFILSINKAGRKGLKIS